MKSSVVEFDFWEKLPQRSEIPLHFFQYCSTSLKTRSKQIQKEKKKMNDKEIQKNKKRREETITFD